MSSPTPGFRSKPDPTKDKAARYVLRAHKNAVAAGKASPECYLAGVEAWRRFHPEHALTYASTQATEVIIRATMSLRPDV